MKLPFFGKKKGVGNRNAMPVYSGLGNHASANSQEAYKSFQELQETAESFNRVKHLDTKRAEIALKFVNWYLVYVAIVLVGVPIFNVYAVGNHQPIDIYKLLGQIGTLLGTPLGFVVGYYFKQDSSKD